MPSQEQIKEAVDALFTTYDKDNSGSLDAK